MCSIVGPPNWRHLVLLLVLIGVPGCGPSPLFEAGKVHLHLEPEAVNNKEFGIVIYDVKVRRDGEENHSISAPVHYWAARGDKELPRIPDDYFYSRCFSSESVNTENGYGYRYFVLDPGYYMLAVSLYGNVNRLYWTSDPNLQIEFHVDKGEVIYIGRLLYKFFSEKREKGDPSFVTVEDHFDEAKEYYHETFPKSDRYLRKKLMRYTRIQPPADGFGFTAAHYGPWTACTGSLEGSNEWFWD